jgi:head-tail adaptor
MLPTDVLASDRLRFNGQLLAIDNVDDAANKGHHLELLCHQVGV